MFKLIFPNKTGYLKKWRPERSPKIMGIIAIKSPMFQPLAEFILRKRKSAVSFGGFLCSD